jgi:hypothetical protein
MIFPSCRVLLLSMFAHIVIPQLSRMRLSVISLKCFVLALCSRVIALFHLLCSLSKRRMEHIDFVWISDISTPSLSSQSIQFR